MMPELIRGRLVARLATDPAEVQAAQRLRQQVFRGRPGLDVDVHDAGAGHLLLIDGARDELLGCCRLTLYDGYLQQDDSYAAQFYDLSGVFTGCGPWLELGRFCLAPGLAAEAGAEALRLAWAAITRIVDAQRVGRLFGCASFHGADPARHQAGLAALVPHARPLGRCGAVVDLPDPAVVRPDPAALPAILRFYLLLGGWVSDHAVVDTDLDTLHVLTVLDPALVPPAIARSLRRIAGP